MQEIYSDVLQFRCNHYEFRKKQWKVRRPRFTIDEQETKDIFMQFAPQMWDEFQGFQDALGWTMTEVLQEFGGYRLEYNKSGCSIFTGSDYLVRNYDYQPKT